MAKFIQPEEILKIETKKGVLELTNSEYLILKEDNKEDMLIINKAGIQKIEDYFEVIPQIPTIQQVWNNNSNFNIIVTIELNSKYGSTYGVASGNPLNLCNAIALSYAVETTLKRAKSTAALELVRKNYVGKEPLGLLYSSFDEFKAENSINNPEIKNTQKPKSGNKASNNSDQLNNKADKSDTKSKNEDDKSSDSKISDKFNDLIFTKKYQEGTTLSYLYENDREYLKLITSKPNKYRDLALEFIHSQNLQL